MHPVSAFVVFIIIWWSVIFCVLPFGVSSTYEEPEEDEEYRAPGSPKDLNIKRKMIITTLISIVLWGIAYVIIESEIIDFRAWALQEFGE